ncbi:MAG TPA: hypothetical protein VFL55_23985 [Acetobacteraceae bacterium]|nr:hypothetical protein [Acetobacteraceae bacterium]
MAPSIGRVLGLVRKLIDYGRQLAATVQQRASAPGFALFAKPFGTADLAAILARITAGLRRATALEAALESRAARGEDLSPAPVREPSPRAAGQVARSETRPEARRTDLIEDPRLARLPTEEEIAIEVRRRPVGAVIADICRDLGIAPGRVDTAFWHELSRTIITYGGSFIRFLQDLDRRWFAAEPGDRTDFGSSAAPQRLPVPTTRPP